MVPAEPLWDVFTPAVIAKLQAIRSPSEYLKCRLAILGAGGLNPSSAKSRTAGIQGGVGNVSHRRIRDRPL